MSQLAIGMIETVGLAAAIEAADVCVKSANVTLIGYELTKGNGMAVVKIEGNVGAVKAAIEGATLAASKVSKVFSTKVIPRPSEGIEFLIKSSDTVGFVNEKIVEEVVEVYESNDEDSNEYSSDEIEVEETLEQISKSELQAEDSEVSNEIYESKEEIEKLDTPIEEVEVPKLDVVEEDESNASDNTRKLSEGEYTCNLCQDPKCPRQKGDLKTTCIHYEDYNK